MIGLYLLGESEEANKYGSMGARALSLALYAFCF
jgi:hypothetical protein